MAGDWAVQMGLDRCVGTLFEQDHGGRGPTSVTELVIWGDRRGLHRAGANDWSCTPGTFGPDQGIGTSGGGFDLSGVNALVDRSVAWVEERPLPVALIAGGVVLFLLKGR